MKNTLLASTTALALASSAQAALTAHFTLDETTGTSVADSSGNSNTGTLVGTADLTATGQSNTGLGVSASGDGFSTGSLISGNAARTVSLWFNASTIDNTQRRLSSVGSGAAGSFDITLENDTGGASIGLRYGNGNMFWSGDSELGQAVQTNTWNHVVVTYDGSTLVADTSLKVYLNGTLLARDGGNNNNSGQTLNTNATAWAFANGAASLASGSIIDDVQVYDTALTQSDVNFLHANVGSTVAVPEPSSTVLLGLGGLALILRRRK